MRFAVTIQSENCQNSMCASPLKNIGVLAVDSMPFPLTPALSLGAREKPLARSVTTTAQIIFQRAISAPLSPRERDRVHAHLVRMRAGDAPAFSLSPRGTSGERVGERGCRFAGLRDAHEPKVTPLPGPLPIRSSWGEGEALGALGDDYRANYISARNIRSPLPKGEGQGEGKGNVNPTPMSELYKCFTTHKYWRFGGGFHALPPHPSPLPWGEGEAPGASGEDWRAENLRRSPARAVRGGVEQSCLVGNS